jgi:hypothetical protein
MAGQKGNADEVEIGRLAEGCNRRFGARLMGISG